MHVQYINVRFNKICSSHMSNFKVLGIFFSFCFGVFFLVVVVGFGEGFVWCFFLFVFALLGVFCYCCLSREILVNPN